MFFKRINDKNTEYINVIKQAAEELRQGKQNYLSVLYQGLAVNEKETVNYAACEIALHMQGLDSNQIIRLEETFREYSSMEWRIFWEKVDLNFWEKSIEKKEDYLWVLRLGTFHPNGYFREKCICKLREDNESVKFVLLRLNDWVEPVRAVAETVVWNWIPKLNVEELVACLPYLDKAKQGRRKDSKMFQKLEAYVADWIEKQLQKVNLQNLKKYELKARKYLYRILLERNLLSKEEVQGVLNREKNGQCQAMLMTMLLNHYELSVEELDALLKYKSKIVQRKALEQKYNIIRNYWDGLEQMLLSSSASVRGQVAYILQKHTEINVVAYYTERLETPYKKMCILGIGEYGNAEDVNMLLKYLEDSEVGIVKSTLRAISRLWGTEASEIFWKYLQDERPVVQRAAFREISANHISFGAKQVYELFVQTDSPLLKEKLAYQFLRERAWERLPYVLRLFWYEEEDVRQVIRRGVYGRSLYGKISKEEAEEIRGILYSEEYRIPEDLRKGIEFDLRFVVG